MEFRHHDKNEATPKSLTSRKYLNQKIMIALIILIIQIIFLVIAILIGRDASKRGMNAWGWGIGVFFLWIIFLPIYFMRRQNNKFIRTVIFAIVGAILGVPLSYFFQSSIIQSKFGGIGGYLQHFGDVLGNSDLVGNVIISVVIFALLGGVIGFFLDRNAAKKTK